MHAKWQLDLQVANQMYDDDCIAGVSVPFVSLRKLAQLHGLT
jgi:hypothetical protein